MSILDVASFFMLLGVLQTSQAPSTPQSAVAPPQGKAAAEPAAPGVYKSDVGFSIAYPLDWELVDSKPMLPAAKLQEEQKAESDLEKRGAECTQIGLLLRHGTPASVIVSVVLPFDCFGSRFAQSDLAGVGSGVSKGLGRNFDMKDPVYAAYQSGTHNLWIERAQGTSKAHPENTYTIETVCGLLDKGMVCVMGMVKSAEDLQIFENSSMTWENDPPKALVPANAFTPGTK